jgi:hypothetical protein
MNVTLPENLAKELTEQARNQGIATHDFAAAIIAKHLAKKSTFVPRDEWERGLAEIAHDCGVSLTNEAVSSDGIYD